nr:hypothetical protein [Tanacetum cinerariifolium]
MLSETQNVNNKEALARLKVNEYAILSYPYNVKKTQNQKAFLEIRNEELKLKEQELRMREYEKRQNNELFYMQPWVMKHAIKDDQREMKFIILVKVLILYGMFIWPPKITLGRLLSHARGLRFKPRRGGFPSGAKNEWGSSPKANVRVLHTAQLDITVSSNH